MGTHTETDGSIRTVTRGSPGILQGIRQKSSLGCFMVQEAVEHHFERWTGPRLVEVLSNHGRVGEEWQRKEPHRQQVWRS